MPTGFFLARELQARGRALYLVQRSVNDGCVISVAPSTTRASLYGPLESKYSQGKKQPKHERPMQLAKKAPSKRNNFRKKHQKPSRPKRAPTCARMFHRIACSTHVKNRRRTCFPSKRAWNGSTAAAVR